MAERPASLADGLLDAIAEAVASRIKPALTKRVLTLAEAAEYIGLTEAALRHKVAARQIPYVSIDRKTRFDVRDLDRWIDEHRRLED